MASREAQGGVPTPHRAPESISEEDLQRLRGIIHTASLSPAVEMKERSDFGLVQYQFAEDVVIWPDVVFSHIYHNIDTIVQSHRDILLNTFSIKYLSSLLQIVDDAIVNTLVHVLVRLAPRISEVFSTATWEQDRATLMLAFGLLDRLFRDNEEGKMVMQNIMLVLKFQKILSGYYIEKKYRHTELCDKDGPVSTIAIVWARINLKPGLSLVMGDIVASFLPEFNFVLDRNHLVVLDDYDLADFAVAVETMHGHMPQKIRLEPCLRIVLRNYDPLRKIITGKDYTRGKIVHCLHFMVRQVSFEEPSYLFNEEGALLWTRAVEALQYLSKPLPPDGIERAAVLVPIMCLSISIPSFKWRCKAIKKIRSILEMEQCKWLISNANFFIQMPEETIEPFTREVWVFVVGHFFDIIMALCISEGDLDFFRRFASTGDLFGFVSQYVHRTRLDNEERFLENLLDVQLLLQVGGLLDSQDYFVLRDETIREWVVLLAECKESKGLPIKILHSLCLVVNEVLLYVLRCPPSKNNLSHSHFVALLAESIKVAESILSAHSAPSDFGRTALRALALVVAGDLPNIDVHLPSRLVTNGVIAENATNENGFEQFSTLVNLVKHAAYKHTLAVSAVAKNVIEYLRCSTVAHLTIMPPTSWSAKVGLILIVNLCARSSKNTKKIFQDENIHETIAKLLIQYKSDRDVAEFAFWALFNVGAGCKGYNDRVFKSKTLQMAFIDTFKRWKSDCRVSARACRVLSLLNAECRSGLLQHGDFLRIVRTSAAPQQLKEDLRARLNKAG